MSPWNMAAHAATSFANAVAAAGTDVNALQAALTTRNGVPTLYAFVDSTTLVEPTLPTLQWYGVLAGSVLATVLAFGKEGEPVTIPNPDESLELGDRLVVLADFEVLGDVRQIVVGDAGGRATVTGGA